MKSIFASTKKLNKVAITGDTQFSISSQEIYKSNKKTSAVEKLKNGKILLKADALNKNIKDVNNLENLPSNVKKQLLSPIDVSWLPFAAGHYRISPNIDDYVVVRVPALTSDIPNRNMQGFSTGSLFEFDIEHGMQRYKTFIGKPMCKNHQNKDLTLAQGAIIDAYVIPVPKYKVVKVMVLALLDRNKCSMIGDALKGTLAYSMGSLANGFTCSICGGVLGPAYQRTCTCYQCNYTDLRSYGRIYNGRLSYILAKEYCFGELTALSSEPPADHTAIGDFIR